MAEVAQVSNQEYRDLFSDESGESDGSDGSDIDFEGFADVGRKEEGSESEENDGEDDENANESSSDTEEEAWSNHLEDFVLEDFDSTPEIKAIVPEGSKADFFFGLLFSISFVDLIVVETNRYARQNLANNADRLAKWVDTTVKEIKAFLGLAIMMGINSLPQLAMYWSENIGNAGVQSVMTKNRFEKLCQYLHFNDTTKEPKCGEPNYDRLFKICPVLNDVLDKAKNTYEPSKNISVDEGMIAFKGRLAFCQYMPAKPTKYSLDGCGFEQWICGEFFYLLGEGKQRAMNSRSWIRCCDGNGRAFSQRASSCFLRQFFTSSKLFDDLLKENMYACGTVRTNRKEMPASASTKEKLKPGEKVVAQRGQLVYTKWHDKKDVSFLSMNVSPREPSRLVPRRVKGQDITIEKPRVADVYTEHMGGVDRADQLRSFYHTGWQSRKWYCYIFWLLFNLSVCNAHVLESFYNKKKRPLIDFKIELGTLLINGFLQRKRKRRSVGPVNAEVPADQHISVHVQGRKRKCTQCIKAGNRTAKGYKVETRFECSLCKVALFPATCHSEFHAASM